MKLIAIQSPVVILYCAMQRNSALALFWVSNTVLPSLVLKNPKSHIYRLLSFIW